MIHLLRLVIAKHPGEYQLLVAQEFAVQTGVEAQFRQEESADTAAGMRVGKPIVGKIAGESGSVIPAGIAVAALSRAFTAESVATAGGEHANVCILPWNIRSRIHVAVPAAKFNVTWTIEPEGDRSQSGNAGRLRRRIRCLLRAQNARNESRHKKQ